jgi:hypothetical protein
MAVFKKMIKGKAAKKLRKGTGIRKKKAGGKPQYFQSILKEIKAGKK